MDTIWYVLVAVISIAIGVFGGMILRKKIAEAKIGSAEEEAKRILLDGEKQAETKKKEALIEAKEEILKQKNESDREIKERRSEISKAERRLEQKEANLDKKSETLEKKNEQLDKKLKDADVVRGQIDEALAKQITILEELSGLSVEEAKEQLIEKIESQVKHVAEATISVVALPSEDMKGRIIGREGRNVQKIETLTGVELIIDDTPEAITISGFDPVRREVARLALEKLIADGRIHPARIEEMVEKAQKEVDASVKKAGDRATYEVGINGINPELVRLLGRLRYRTSYGQNVLKHSIEVAFLAGMMAEELGVDANIARRAGLLHDIGKAFPHDVEGSHVEIGVNAAKKYKESREVVHAIEAHHNDVEPKTIVAILVQAADAISAARPGARREDMENYIKRLQKLEEIATSFAGVDKAFAIQAGREVRVMVKPEQVNDDGMKLIAREMAAKIQEEMKYPGQIKVHLIRESRVADYAK